MVKFRTDARERSKQEFETTDETDGHGCRSIIYAQRCSSVFICGSLLSGRYEVARYSN